MCVNVDILKNTQRNLNHMIGYDIRFTTTTIIIITRK